MVASKMASGVFVEGWVLGKICKSKIPRASVAHKKLVSEPMTNWLQQFIRQLCKNLTIKHVIYTTFK